MPVKRGEIYFVNLNPTKGREQAGVYKNSRIGSYTILINLKLNIQITNKPR